MASTRRGFLLGSLAAVGAVSATPLAGEPVTATAAGLEFQPPLNPDSWSDGYLSGQASAQLLKAPSTVVLGAVYDLLGYLTTLETPITLGSSLEVYPAIDALSVWLRKRDLFESAADVSHWRKRLVDDTDVDRLIADARDEGYNRGYNRGYDVASARADSRTNIGYGVYLRSSELPHS